MPEGQFLGARSNHIYTSDGGQEYVLTTDATLGAIANNGLPLATTANGANAPRRPVGLRPRYVLWQGTLNGRTVRKKIICGTTDAALFAAVSSQALTIDGTAGFTTGKVGERVTFLRLQTPAPQT